MKHTRALLALCLSASALTISSVRAAETQTLELPPEITPAIREACEQNVRSLCSTANPTLDGVASCVRRNYLRLNKRCQNELKSAGLL
jgi:hypothetical protein